MARILVVDDEQDLCEILRFNLESEQFDVHTATSAEEALRIIHGGGLFDLLILDVMMEHMSGFEMARQLRSEGNEVPIIFLTALSAEADQLKGFDAGADDYISKPFSFSTVLARVRAVLKRTASVLDSDIVDAPIRIATSDSSVWLADEHLQLTKKEYLILLLLMQNKGRYFSREDILSRVWDDDICVNDRSVDVHIARLRKKLGDCGSRIVNRTGFGYAYYRL